MSKTIIFFGTEDFSAESLGRLIDDGHNIAAVVTKPDRAKGRSKKMLPSPVKVTAQGHDIPVWQPENVNDIAKSIENIPDRIGVLVSYGKIIPKNILDLFEPIGIINLHPSLLPRYRGPSPIESAILHGDKETGISFIKLTEEMDAGPIYYQTTVELNKNENAAETYDTLSAIGATELTQVITEITAGNIQAKPQDETKSTYCQLLKKEDGVIDWNKPALQIEREVRAYNVWPKSRAKLGNVEVIITKAHLESGSDTPGKVEIIDDKLLVYCGKDCLGIDKIQPIGKKEMPIQAFLAGYKDQITAE